MAWEGILIKLPNLVAGEDLSLYQYCFVALDTSNAGKVVKVASAASRPIGVLQNNPKADEEAEVAVFGVTKVWADEQLAVGDSVKVGYPTGQDTQVGGQAAKAGTSSTNSNVGTVLLGAAAQAIASVFINTANLTYV
jgi:hypothetical protein